ncbi:unnamed protein product [Paramecium octaurelia]|uniref:Uncharacterized protein n=1 Tax=Paramecium octaurelia TaxID=43137 RepID=A0A8S1SA71_PAROT|nr:unnamed protein product [Paramecium octaurelia]
MSQTDKELKRIEELEEQVNQALKRSRQLDDSTKFDESFFKQELKEMQERCQQNQQTMIRLEQKYLKTGYELKNSDIIKESSIEKSSVKQKSLLEQKNQQIQELQKKLFDTERQYNQQLSEVNRRNQQLEYQNQQLQEDLQNLQNQQESIPDVMELHRALEELQKQYLDLQNKLQETMRNDQQDYQQIKQEYEEYQLLTQNIINQEEEYQRRICELEEELQQSSTFQQEFMSRMKSNEELYSQRYRDLKQKYQQQLDDQRKILDQQIDELREQNNYLFGQLSNAECKIQQLEFEIQRKSNLQTSVHQENSVDLQVSRSKSFSACHGAQNVKTLSDCEINSKAKPQHYVGCYNKGKQSCTQQSQQISNKQDQRNDYKQYDSRPVKQINISIEKENIQADTLSSYNKVRSQSKEQPITYKQVAEQRQAILYSKIPKPRR